MVAHCEMVDALIRASKITQVHRIWGGARLSCSESCTERAVAETPLDSEIGSPTAVAQIIIIKT